MITCPETEAATTTAVDASECESIGDIKASAIEHQTMRVYMYAAHVKNAYFYKKCKSTLFIAFYPNEFFAFFIDYP